MIKKIHIALWCCLFVCSAAAVAQTDKQTEAQKKQNLRRSLWTPERFIGSIPNTVIGLQRYNENWQKYLEDRRPADEIDRTRKMFTQSLFYHFRSFSEIESTLPDSFDAYPEMLEFYDRETKNAINWLVDYLQTDEWQSLFATLDTTQRERILVGLDADALQAVRDRQVEFYTELLEAAEAIPYKFRRSRMDKFRRFDEPALPEGGFVRLQQAFSQKLVGLKIVSQSVVTVKAYIAEDGEVLRVRIQDSSFEPAVDSVAVVVVQNTVWQPAKMEGKPFKTDVIVPLRVWLRKEKK